MYCCVDIMDVGMDLHSFGAPRFFMRALIVKPSSRPNQAITSQVPNFFCPQFVPNFARPSWAFLNYLLTSGPPGTRHPRRIGNLPSCVRLVA